VNRPPGFIDTHYHAVDPSATKVALREGVTTGTDLEQVAFNSINASFARPEDWVEKLGNK